MSKKLYSKELMRELKESGLSGALASKVVNAVIRATDAEDNLLAVCNEIEKRGKTEIAGRIWFEHSASLLVCIPREHRRESINILLKLADGMERELLR